MPAGTNTTGVQAHLHEACRMISSVLDEESVLNLALDAVVRLSGAIGGVVAEPKDGTDSLRVVHTTPGHARLRQAFGAGDLKALRVVESWVTQRPTTTTTDSIRAAERRRMLASFRIASVAAAPVIGRHGPLQVMVALHQEASVPDEAVTALRLIARQTGVSVENARQHAAVEAQQARARVRLEVLAQASRAFSTTTELSAILEVIMDQCRTLCQCEAGTLVMVGQDGQCRVADAFPRGEAPDVGEAGVGPLVTWCIETGLPLLMGDLAQHADVDEQVTTQVPGGIRDALCVPLVFGEQVLGAIELANKVDDDGFDNEDREVVANFASHAAIIIKNALLLQEVSELAIRDALTGLYNRRRFREALTQALAQHRRYRSDLTLILMDVDKFKTINDTRGHAAGDAVLRMVADICTRTTRDTDTVARLGGDEFAILLPHTPLEGAVRLAERLQEAADEAELPGSAAGVSISFSQGIADAATEGISEPEEFLSAADQSMYAAKRAGGRQTAVYAAALPDGPADRTPATITAP